MAPSRKQTWIGNDLLEPPTFDWDQVLLVMLLREGYIIPENKQDGNNINLKTAGPNELNHTTRIPANQVSFPYESQCRKGNMEKDDIIQDDGDDLELAVQSTPVLGTHNAPLGKASESKVYNTRCKRERSSSINEALDNSIAKSPKQEAGSRKASTSWYLKKINYVDGDVDTLDLTKECWHFADRENLNPILELETYKGPPPPSKRGGSKRKRKKQRH